MIARTFRAHTAVLDGELICLDDDGRLNSRALLTRKKYLCRVVPRRAERLRYLAQRCIDDVVVLTPTPWKLRGAVALLNGLFTTLGLEKLPAIMGRGLVGLGVCVAGAGILACFAAVGALGMLGQRCAALWPTAAQPARQLTAP